MHACLVAQSCLTFWSPMNCSLPGSSVHEILQARILEWVAMPFSRGIFLTQGSNPVSYVSSIGRWVLYHLGSPGSQEVPPGKSQEVRKTCLIPP